MTCETDKEHSIPFSGNGKQEPPVSPENIRSAMCQVGCNDFSRITLSHAQVEGSPKRQTHAPCEDVVFKGITEEFVLYGLADGQSGTQYGAAGSQACLEAIFGLISSVGIENLINSPFPDELPCLFVQAIRKVLLPMTNSRNTDLKEFASTLLIITVSLKSGRYILLHLGDGCAISIPNIGDPAFISKPDTGLTSRHTWLTTSDNAIPHFHVTFGSIENKKRILLVSDGAVCFCRGQHIPWRAKDLLTDGSQLQLHEYLMQSEPLDDATCIVLDFHSTVHHSLC